MEGVFMVVLFFIGAFIGMLTLSLVAINHDNHEANAAREETARVTRQYQVLVLADDFYSEIQHRKNRIHQLQFEMQYCDNDFTAEWPPEERKEIAEVCEVMLEQEREDYLANLDEEENDTGTRRMGDMEAKKTWEPKITLDDNGGSIAAHREIAHAL
jgi:hypothetical protein